MSEALKVCLRRQEELFERVSKAQINYKKSPKDRLTVNYIETKIEALNKLWESFLSIHNEVVASVDKSEKSKLTYFAEDMYSEFEDIYETYKIKLKDDLQLYQPTSCVSASNNQTSTVATSSDVRLPTIHLPKFSCGYENWQTFYDMFVSLIHTNATLTAAQKLHYLKSCLSGEAEILLKNLSTTDVNYNEAWSQLVRRYNNKRFNTNEVMKRLFSQKNVTSESPAALKQLLDTTSSCLKSLQNLEIDTSAWDAIIIYLVVTRVDAETRKLWELEVSRVHSDGEADSLPTWEELKRFIETRFRTLEMLESSNHYNCRAANTTQYNNTTRQTTKQRSFHSSVEEEKREYTCVMCSGQHLLYQCKQFAAQTPEKRTEYVQSNHLCFNCLSPFHSVRSCYSTTSCRRCARRHHTLLHYERTSNREERSTAEVYSNHENTSPEVQERSQQPERKIVAHFTNESQLSRVLLATAMVKIKSPTGHSQIVRALIDQGSEASFITEATAQVLKLKRVSVNSLISGVGEGQTQTKSMASFEILSLHNPEFSIQVNAFVLKRLTSFIPSRDSPIHDWPEITNLPLADPTYSTPGRIDIILGAEVYGEILLDGLLKHSKSSGPVAQNTQLGWILSGKIKNELVQENRNIISMHIQVKEDELLKQFWETEGEPESFRRRKTREKMQYKEIYEKTTEERDLRDAYDVYLPHHAVIKEQKQTTRGRVIFDASSKGENDVSLNNNMLVGPTLQSDLRNILVRGRYHRVCTVAELFNMYRQVVNKQDTDFQRILWRSNLEGHVQHYQLLRLTFGTSCEPYVAVKCLQQLSKDEQPGYPLTAQITLQDYYMNHLLTGCKTTEQTIDNYHQMNTLMRAGGFELRKWSSNSKELLEHICKDNQIDNQLLYFKYNDNTKVLRVIWNKTNYEFERHLQLPNNEENREDVTKRKLPEKARPYNPMSYTVSNGVRARSFKQNLWRLKLSWDGKITPQLLHEWQQFIDDLLKLEKIFIPRWLRNRTSEILTKLEREQWRHVGIHQNPADSASRERGETSYRAKSKLPDELLHLLADEETAWRYHPPHEPNFGGVFIEADVRTTIVHLKRVI
ncbi:PREDICTED: uncharacterized protein LOC106118482 [Papilio xuthus]|uniref:Uncharacterized protein LOC106118482 n=1 Tax=Papilio xuthus TaxID=66420 RepID=A0AAJ6ZAM7_PAPXU|nr:PREDICTED: uncharacterized protein LOC106118482 [Papilio xuthus]